MTGRVFADSNVLVYSSDVTEVEKQQRARHWLDALWRARAGRLSVQVLNEFYSIVTGKLPRPLEREEARKIARSLFAWEPVALSPAIVQAAWMIQDRFRLSWWDALIASAARSADCRFLLSEDLQEGQDFDGLLVVNPFRTEPAELGL